METTDRSTEIARLRERLSAFDSGEFSQVCDYCGAQPSERCRTPRGRAAGTHGNRWHKVMAPNTVGYAQGLRDALELGPEQALNQLDWIVKRLAVLRQEGRL